MPDRIRKSLELVLVILGVGTGLTGMFGAFVLLPSRVEALERVNTRLVEREEKGREALIRLEERAKRIEDKLDLLAGHAAAERRNKP